MKIHPLSMAKSKWLGMPSTLMIPSKMTKNPRYLSQLFLSHKKALWKPPPSKSISSNDSYQSAAKLIPFTSWDGLAIRFYHDSHCILLFFLNPHSIYLAVLGLSCNMWDPVLTRDWTRVPALWVSSLSHRTTREVHILPALELERLGFL